MIGTIAALLLFSAAPSHVVDEVGLFSDYDRQSMESELASFEKTDGIEVVVVARGSLAGRPIELATFDLARQWSVGSRDGGHGVLIGFYRDDREVRIEVSNGIPHLDDAAAKRIVDGTMVPYFKTGGLTTGLEAGCRDLFATVRGQRGAAAAPAASYRSSPKRWYESGGGIALFLILAVGRMILFPGSWGYGRRNSWSSSSWSSHSSWGGGGGFRGGGGGGFSGHGASGKW